MYSGEFWPGAVCGLCQNPHLGTYDEYILPHVYLCPGIAWGGGG